MVDAWSPCQPAPERQSDIAGLGHCVGRQRRRVLCLYRGDPITDHAACHAAGAPPLPERTCHLTDCSVSCVVGAWSGWSETHCYSRLQYRTRSVQRAPASGGRACPPLSESRPGPLADVEQCAARLPSFTARYSSWSACQPPPFAAASGNDGGGFIGFQSRSVDCLGQRGRPALAADCNLTEAQTESQPCQLLPQWLFQWTPWTLHCGSSTGSRPTRNRHRLAYRLGPDDPTSAAAAAMLRDFQSEPASGADYPDGARQGRYCWLATPWSECRPGVPGECGRGYRRRAVYCADCSAAAGSRPPVDLRLCPAEARPPVLAEDCTVSCPVIATTAAAAAALTAPSCPLSEWSQWSICGSAGCTKEPVARVEGTSKRTRRVLGLNANPDDENCPHLEEGRVCRVPPCHTWRINEEAGPQNCRPNNGDCGPGVANNNRTCVDYLQQTVTDASNCDYIPDYQKPLDRVLCHKPCSGDCVISEWSAWSPCSRSCGLESFATRWRHVIANPGPEGQSCPTNLLDTRACEVPISCASFHWLAGPWPACTGRTAQKRQLTCQGANLTLCAVTLQPPLEIRVCPEVCDPSGGCQYEPFERLDIQGFEKPLVIRFLKKSCDPSKCPPYQLDLSKSGEPASLESLPLSMSATVGESNSAATAEWRIGDWSDCILPRVVSGWPCGSGVRIRNVTCASKRLPSGWDTRPISDCLTSQGRPPTVRETCERSCVDQVCLFSDWSGWSSCSVQGQCMYQRWRYKTLQRGNLSHCLKPGLEVNQRSDCDCDREPGRTVDGSNLQPGGDVDGSRSDKGEFRLLPVGQWSPCLLLRPDPRLLRALIEPSDVSTSSLDSGGNCGGGMQFRSRVCYDQFGRQAPEHFCREKPLLLSKPCEIPCPVDCRLSEWGPWGGCSASCSGLRRRQRWPRREARSGGRACPSDQGEESEPCSPPCEAFTWLPGNWGPCEGSDCGQGTSRRQLRCWRARRRAVDANAEADGLDADGQEVDSAQCERFASGSRPTSAKGCKLPCSGDCVLTDWTAWTPCLECPDKVGGFLSNPAMRTRSRIVLRENSQGTCRIQNQLRESQACSRGETCGRHRWALTDWSPCQPVTPAAVCGGVDFGRRRRRRVCLRVADGRQVDDANCDGEVAIVNIAASSEALVENCEPPCNRDCVLTQWSEWTPCDNNCRLGLNSRNRSRSALIHHAGTGRACPTPLLQTQPCGSPARCFIWRLTDWSECRVVSATPATSRTQASTGRPYRCGVGEHRRKPICFQRDRPEPLPEEYCTAELLGVDAPLVEACELPCPQDCQISEWSPWSMCQTPCYFNFTDGFQFRSRVAFAERESQTKVCPQQQQIDYRPCRSATCPNYHWTVTDWSAADGVREVWCQNERGELAEGGCTEAIKPSTRRRCHPPCSARFSYCNQLGRCQCPTYFSAELDFEGRLIACSPAPVTAAGADKFNPSGNYSWPARQGRALPLRASGSRVAMEMDEALNRSRSDAVLSLWIIPVFVAAGLFLLAVAVALVLICREIYTRHRHSGSNSGAKIANSSSSTRLHQLPQRRHQQQQQQRQGLSPSSESAVRGSALIRLHTVHSSAEQLLPGRGDCDRDSDSMIMEAEAEAEEEEEMVEVHQQYQQRQHRV